MKFLQCACLVGAVAALSPLTARGPSTVSKLVSIDESVRVDESMGVHDPQDSVAALTAAPIELASLEDAHANLLAAFAAFALTSAYPMPMSSSYEETTASAETPTARLRGVELASAEPFPELLLSPASLTDLRPWQPPPPKALAARDPLTVGSLSATATRLAYAALPDVTLDPMSPAPPLERETADFSYLAYYAYAEVLPPEKPADTVLRALKDIPQGTPREEVRRAARAFGLDVTLMEAVAKIESDFDPKQRTGSYIGLFQLSKYEFNSYGSGEITNARDNAIAGVYKFAIAAKLFELQTHVQATPAYLYLIHQQGTQGAAEHVGRPDRIAWESMCATDEGKVKGERWCKRAIWQNTLPEVKKAWGSVEKLTSAAFVEMWRNRVVTLYRRYAASASAAASQ